MTDNIEPKKTWKRRVNLPDGQKEGESNWRTPRSKRPYNKGSMNARLVARDVIAKIEKGEKVELKPILEAHGYAKATAWNPKQVTTSVGYQDEMNTYAEKLNAHRAKVLAEMERKDLSEEQYKTLSDAQAKLTHDVQLLTGGKTENVGMDQDRATLKAIVAAIQIDTNPTE